MNNNFDGDENNIFIIHCMMAEAEARMLNAPKYNFASQSPVMGYVINMVTAAYIMSRDNLSVETAVFDKLTSLLQVTRDIRVTRVAAKMGRMGLEFHTTRGLLSLLMPEGFNYSKKGVYVYDGIVIRGAMDRSVTGPKAGSLLHKICIVPYYVYNVYPIPLGVEHYSPVT